jgi:hypothetical protein
MLDAVSAGLHPADVVGQLNPYEKASGDISRTTLFFFFHKIFDGPFKTTKYWAFGALKRFRLRGFVILKSSKKHYHMVFDRPVRWETNVKITNWVALESGNADLQRYARMQCIKKTSTARVSWKKGKTRQAYSPNIFRFGRQNRQVKKFLETRKFILDSLKQLKKAKKQTQKKFKLLESHQGAHAF